MGAGASGLGRLAAQQTGIVAKDTMARTVTAGFGRASVGGTYTVTSPARTSVRPGTAYFAPVTRRTAVSAYLSHVNTRDIGMRVGVVAPVVRPQGGGLYVYLALRVRPNADSYYAKLHFRADRAVTVALTRMVNGHETFLTAERTVIKSVPSGALLDVDAQALGSGPTRLAMRVWRDGAATPSGWQAAATDSTSALQTAGAIGLRAYLSSSAQAPQVIGFRQLLAWSGAIPGTPASPHPPASSSTPAPSSSASSSPTRPTTSASSTSAPPSSSSSSTSSPNPPSPPAGSGGAGSAPIGSTSYAVPSNAIVVAPSGSDSAAGTLDRPLRTLARAISVAPSGATIVLRGGTYHESDTVPSNKSLTIQAYPQEAVWLDGSTSVSGWRAAGGHWIHDGWTAEFDSTPGYTSGSGSSAFINPQYPMAAHPDQVWLDGTALQQVGSASQVGPGSFYVDYSAKQLVLGQDPASHTVLASDLSLALTVSSPHSVVRGIGVRRYATPIPLMGALRLGGSNDTVENVVASDNATTGVTVGGKSTVVRDVTVTGNGMLGLHANYADGIVISSVLATGNNTQHFNQAPVSGGVKVTRTRGVTVTDSRFIGNLGYGLWLDESCYNMTVARNVMSGNTASGMSLEISALGLVVGNVSYDNGQDGMKLNDTSDLTVWNNTVYGNQRQIALVQDDRRGANLSVPGHDPRQTLPDPTEPWIIRNAQIVNNFVGLPRSGGFGTYLRDFSDAFQASNLNLTLNGNRYATSGSTPIIVWPITVGKIATYTSTVSFQSATGQGVDNTQQSAGGAQASTMATSVAARPLPVPASVAALLGVPTGTRQTGAGLAAS